MTEEVSATDFSREQQELWDRVAELWSLAQSRDEQRIASALHAEYAGWETNAPLPHDRDAAVRSVSEESPQIATYTLQPHSVRVYDHRVGVVHYSYSATVVPPDSDAVNVSGKWTEIYLKQDGGWKMIAVSGRPDPPRVQ